MRLLLPHSDPLARDNYGYSALMWAAGHGYEACVELLLPVSDPLSKNSEGDTALMRAAGRGQEACVRLLLPVSNLFAKNSNGYSASEWAEANGYPNLAEMIDAYALAQKEEALIATHVPQESTQKVSSKLRI